MTVTTTPSKRRAKTAAPDPGVIARPNGTWQIRYRLDGRQRAETFDTVSQANARMRQVRADLANGRTKALAPSKMSLSQYYRHYTAAKAPGWTPSTRHLYASTYATLTPALLDAPLPSITPSMITAWLSTFQARSLAQSTIRTHHSRLRAVFAAALDDDIIPTNPAAKRSVRPPAAALRSIDADEIPTRDEVDAITTHLPPHLAIITTLGADLGLRSGEMRAVKVSDVDPLHLVVHVRRQLVRQRDPGHTGPRTEVEAPCKHHSERTVTMTQQTATILTAHIATYAAPTQADPDPYLLQSTQTPGHHLDSNTASTRFRHAATKADITSTKRTLHALRHLRASELAAAGVPPIEAAHELGHSVQVYLASYAHLTGDHRTRLRTRMTDYANTNTDNVRAIVRTAPSYPA